MWHQIRVKKTCNAGGQPCYVGIGHLRDTSPSRFQIPSLEASLARRHRDQRGRHTGFSLLWSAYLE